MARIFTVFIATSVVVLSVMPAVYTYAALA